VSEVPSLKHRMHDGREVEVGEPIPGGRYNGYVCRGEAGKMRVEDSRMVMGPALHTLLSLDVDDGVTPMFVWCPDHDCEAVSEGYPPGAPPTALFPVRMVWRHATRGEEKRERREGGNHYRQGGLAREWVTL
jgi:hypothetical protein